ncbi:MAG TPA: hypothetical protein VF740_14285, partial [Candidatus Acidoferrum sp.]
MHMHSLHWLAILVAAVASMILGFLWSSPLLFAVNTGYQLVCYLVMGAILSPLEIAKASISYAPGLSSSVVS